MPGPLAFEVHRLKTCSEHACMGEPDLYTFVPNPPVIKTLRALSLHAAG
jgi:hypothetical protein